LDDNEKLIERGLSKQGPGEIKVTQEIEKLTKRLTQLNSELDKMKLKREEELTPLRMRGEELSGKLELVRNQLQSVRNIRERSLSLSSLDIKNRSLSEEEQAPPPYNENY